MAKKQKRNYIRQASKQVRGHNSDQLRTLIFDKGFQKEVLRLRERLGIPAEGIKTDMTREKVATPEGRAEFNDIKEKFDTLYKEPFVWTINKILDTNSLKRDCFNVVAHYILFNEQKFFQRGYFQIPERNFHIRTDFYFTPEGRRTREEIVITGHLTENEYKALKKLQDEVFGERKRRRARRNIDRDIEIAEKSGRKGKGDYETDREMADHIEAFQDDGTDVESLRGLSSKQAKVIKQARHRLKNSKFK